jgi:hypothetical protein
VAGGVKKAPANVLQLCRDLFDKGEIVRNGAALHIDQGIAVTSHASQAKTGFVFLFLSFGGELKQPDYFATQPLNLFVLGSQLQSAARLKISFCAGSAGCSRISSFFKSIIGEAPSKMCGQTHVRWIHDYRGSQTIKDSVVYPFLNPFGNCAL